MVFELTEELVDQIMFAMENQGEVFVLDSSVGQLVPSASLTERGDSRYYNLPEWDSSNGFRMMERFVSLQKNPTIRHELREVLFSGKGVFRNFKNVLKSFPEAEKKWFAFRESEMNQHIFQWYNMLRDTWGLEKLGDEPEESEDLVHGDFIFREYQKETDEEFLDLAVNSIMAEREAKWPGEIGVALSQIWQRQYVSAEPDTMFSLISETVDGDFAGCISVASCPSYASKTVLMTTFFVLQDYRGLGIGKELLSLTLANLKKRGIQWVILSDIVIPDFFVPCLTRHGFVSTGGGYILNLNEEQA